ncbi:hypothetical protein vseg_006054 [Gypsophila vaccaria]
MAGHMSKWAVLVAVMWIQAVTGTNFDFGAYSRELKAALGLTQVELSYLATASDMGKVLGWSSGVALMWLPLWVVVVVAGVMGFVAYGLQWCIVCGVFSPPYFMVILLCLLAGTSICWFNTVCFVLCIRNFPTKRALAISLTVSFNGVSAALYALTANAVNSSSSSIYLFLNAVVPLVTSLAALIPILQQPEPEPQPPPEALRRDSFIFLLLNFVAAMTGFYNLFLTSFTNSVTSSRLLFVGAILLLIFPVFVPGIVSGFSSADAVDLEFCEEVSRQGNFIRKGELVMLGEEHSAAVLVRRLDFWLYYVVYFCGGTIGLVYSNNLGQIAESRGLRSSTTTLLTLYSSFSFFGRLLSATPDFIRSKFLFARTGWLALALTPTPIAFFLLSASGSALALKTGTALIGLSSGFIFAAAVSITSDLFGPSSVGVNHNILITNIPIGSLLYGFLAALVYDANSGPTREIVMVTDDALVCMGRRCYHTTFVLWGCLSVVGFVSSVVLFLRTRRAYERFEWLRVSSQFD